MKTEVIKEENKKNWTRFQVEFLILLTVYIILNIYLLFAVADGLKKAQSAEETTKGEITFWENIKSFFKNLKKFGTTKPVGVEEISFFKKLKQLFFNGRLVVSFF